MPTPSPAARDMLTLTLVPDLGPQRIRRLVEQFGSPSAALNVSASQLERVPGIGPKIAPRIAGARRDRQRELDTELTKADSLGVSIVAIGDPGYPALLAPLADAPPILYVRGQIDAGGADRYTVAIVGSRECSQYGLEQARRFAGVLASAGLTVVSGGARGIDSASHRGALTSQGRTLAVLGCGLASVYPPENSALFDEIASGRGAVISELPLDTPPKAENFPARNRIISGISLGVLVIEAADRSGALITARLAAEEHGREVMALPGRVDAPASRGTLKLIKDGGAALVTDPGDVLALLESAARHLHGGTHEARFAPAPASPTADLFDAGAGAEPESEQARETSGQGGISPDPTHGVPGAVLAALDEARTLDEIAASTGLQVGEIRTALTTLEIQRRVRRIGPKFERITR